MNLLLILIFAAVVLALSGILLGAFSVWQTRALAGSMEARIESTRQEAETRNQALGTRLDALAAQLKEVEKHPSVTLTPGVPKLGMNVSKRAQVLRLHRRGDQPEKIAAALELPRQEVDLLLKIHTIVISNV